MGDHQPGSATSPAIPRAAHRIVSRLKFLDEAGSQLNISRRYSRAAPGQRVVEAVAADFGSNYTLTATRGLDGLQAPRVLEGALDAESFKLDLAKVFAPTLKPGDILIMNKLPTHEVPGVELLVQARGARVEYLSLYSPDNTPVERCWSKIKTHLRSAKARSYAALVKAIRTALRLITDADVHAWFDFCGYPLH